MIFLDLSDIVSPYPMQVSNCIWDCLILVDSLHNFCNSYHAGTGFSFYGIRFFLLHKLFQSCYQGSCSVQGEVLGVGCFPIHLIRLSILEQWVSSPEDSPNLYSQFFCLVVNRFLGGKS